MQANSPPTRVDAVWLYTSKETRSRLPGCAWTRITWVACSPCYSYLAAVVESRQSDCEEFLSSTLCETDDEASLDGCDIDTYEVHVYCTSAGNKQTARLFTGVRWPVMKWSASGNLLIAQLLQHHRDLQALTFA